MNFDTNGNLPLGFHDMTLAEIEYFLVATFTQSITRRPIFDGYCRLRNTMHGVGLSGEQYLDGSYTTTKENPEDLDLVSVIPKNLLDTCPTNIDNEISDARLTKTKYGCHSFLVPSVPDGDPEYDFCTEAKNGWLEWFSRDRSGNSKGLVRTTL